MRSSILGYVLWPLLLRLVFLNAIVSCIWGVFFPRPTQTSDYCTFRLYSLRSSVARWGMGCFRMLHNTFFFTLAIIFCHQNGASHVGVCNILTKCRKVFSHVFSRSSLLYFPPFLNPHKLSALLSDGDGNGSAVDCCTPPTKKKRHSHRAAPLLLFMFLFI